LQKDQTELAQANIQVVAISYDSEEVLKKFAEERAISFPLLADTGSKTIDAYQVRNADVPKGGRIDGVPHPGTFLLDEKGVVRAKLFKEGYRARHTTDELLKAAKLGR
jgi:peroxiredoxin